MDNYLIISNEDKDPSGKYLKKVQEELIKNGACFSMISDQKPCPDNTRAAIVLGGDGTLMRAVRQVKDFNIPILGINTGTIGFLTGAEVGDIEKAIECLVKGSYRTEERMMLDVSLNGKKIDSALNDAVITRSGYSRIVRLSVLINGTAVFSAGGDGVVVATPTGSTGYNLSAGGSICVPEARMIFVTPICPHSMSSRPIIASDKDEVTVELPIEKNDDLTDLGVTVDGEAFIKLKGGDRVTVKKSERSVILIKTEKITFFEALKYKLP